MKDSLIKAWRFLRQWWWAFLAIAGGVFALALGVTTRRTSPPGTSPSDPQTPPPPTFSERAKEQVDRVKLEGEVEKARVQAQSDVHHAEIDRIADLGETNPTEARRQLASWLTQNL